MLLRQCCLRNSEWLRRLLHTIDGQDQIVGTFADQWKDLCSEVKVNPLPRFDREGTLFNLDDHLACWPRHLDLDLVDRRFTRSGSNAKEGQRSQWFMRVSN